MKKFIVLGLDGAVPGIIDQYVRKGLLLNFKRLAEEGTYGTNLPFTSAVTPGNWAAIASGAYPGTVGISDFCVHVPGDPLDDFNMVFDSDWCFAEMMWDSLSRQGFKTATINYPGGRPRKSEGHTSIGDNGAPGENSHEYMLAPARLFVSESLNPAGPYNWEEHEYIKLTKPTMWENIPQGYKSVQEAQIEVKAVNAQKEGCHRYHILQVDTGQNFRVVISKEKDYARRLADIGVNEWSDWIQDSFLAEKREIKALFRFRPIILDSEGKLQIYLSPVCPVWEFADPLEYGRLLYEKAGPHCDVLNVSNLVKGWIDPQGFLDEIRMQGMWHVRAALELINHLGHVGVFTKWHAFDKFYHFFFNKIDPVSPDHNPDEFEYYERIHKGILKIADDMVGTILDEMDNDTTVIVMSDHGLSASNKFVWVNNYLLKHGYISTYKDEKGHEKIDWSSTKAVLHPFVTIWVNLKGRDPQGCVKPEEYDLICNELVELLKDWKDIETGTHVFADVFRIEDGIIYGLWGERDGDIRIHTNPGYTLFRSRDITHDRCLITTANGPYKGDHGSCRPSARYGRGSELAFFGAAGYRIRKGYKRKVPIKPCDVVPTLCKIINAQPPKNSEGAVLNDILCEYMDET